MKKNKKADIKELSAKIRLRFQKLVSSSPRITLIMCLFLCPNLKKVIETNLD